MVSLGVHRSGGSTRSSSRKWNESTWKGTEVGKSGGIFRNPDT